MKGECVEMGTGSSPIHGNWGEWSPWSACTRECGAGVQHRQRECDNPAPKHGGRYCVGTRREYRICNVQECWKGETSFRDTQCQDFNVLPYKGKTYTWTAAFSRGTSKYRTTPKPCSGTGTNRPPKRSSSPTHPQKPPTLDPLNPPANPCELRCRPEGELFSVVLKESAADGTPCNPGSRDMCIAGICK
ncbi:unnamed protein product, partial [Darwinula stevensoni]